MTEKLGFGDQTLLHPLGLVFCALMCVLLLCVRRSRAVIPMIMLACFIPSAQRIVILGLDFTMLRLLMLCGAVRVLSRGETRGIRLGTLDRTLIAYVCVRSLVNVILHGTSSVLIYNLGISFDALGVYFLVRVLVRSWEDLDATIGGFVLVACILVVAFGLERFADSHRNYFSILGGVAEITSARQGKVRAQGAFPHAIIAGCYWVGVLPLLLARFWTRPRLRFLTFLAVLSSLLIIFTTASSTPIAGTLLALAAAAFFPFRRLVPQLGWGALIGVIGLHLVMKAPVWHLISRIDLVGGSTGWHRFYLIDQAIHRVSEWWLVGTRSKAHWGAGLEDGTNQYVIEGTRGGLVSLCLFLLVVALALRGVARMVRATEGDRPRLILSWMVGASLFAHLGMFMAVTYFGQIYSLWFFTLAVIASLEQRALSVATPAPRAAARGVTAAVHAGATP